MGETSRRQRKPDSQKVACWLGYRTDSHAQIKKGRSMNELQKMENPLPAVRAEDPMMLLTLAVERGADVGTLERLSVLRDKFIAERARKAYYDSLSAFQSEVPVIKKRNRVVFSGGEKYRYAPIDHIIKVVGPLLQKHGFAFQRDSKVEAGWVEAVVTITHREGHSETKSFRIPTDSKAAMSEQQRYGAALTFADRYAFCGALGIKTGDEDTDCAPAPDGPDTIAGLKKELWDLLKPKRGTENNWNQARQWLVDEMCLDPDTTIKQLDAAGLRAVIDRARQKLYA